MANHQPYTQSSGTNASSSPYGQSYNNNRPTSTNNAYGNPPPSSPSTTTTTTATPSSYVSSASSYNNTNQPTIMNNNNNYNYNNNVYGKPTLSSSSTVSTSTSTGYGNQPTILGASLTSSSNTNVYGALPVQTQATQSNNVATSTYTTTTNNNNNNNNNNVYGKLTSSVSSATGYSSNQTTGSACPPFSQTLDLPAPNHQQQQQQQQQQVLPGATTVTGIATNIGAANNYPGSASYSSTNNSTTKPIIEYQPNSKVRLNQTSGQTTGLISEGNPVRCHKIDYEIKGYETQLVEIELDPRETVIGEAGAMMFMEDGIKFESKFGDGAEPKKGFFGKLMAAGGRLMTGESLFITHFTNESEQKCRVAFAAPYPGSIVPVNLADQFGQSITCQRDAFLCAALGTKLSMAFNKRIGSGLFGGEGFILEKLEGDGMTFLHAGGTIIKRELNNERIRLDTGCLVAFTTKGIDFEIMLVPGLKSMFFGGEGLFLAVLKGTGSVWIQSLPLSRMADRIVQAAPSAGGQRVGEGSLMF